MGFEGRGACLKVVYFDVDGGQDLPRPQI